MYKQKQQHTHLSADASAVDQLASAGKNDASFTTIDAQTPSIAAPPAKPLAQVKRTKSRHVLLRYPLFLSALILLASTVVVDNWLGDMNMEVPATGPLSAQMDSELSVRLPVKLARAKLWQDAKATYNALYDLGFLYEKRGDMATAARYYAEAVKQEDRFQSPAADDRMRFVLCRYYLDQKRNKDADKLVDDWQGKALMPPPSLHVSYAAFYRLQSEVLEKNGKHEDAVQALEKAEQSLITPQLPAVLPMPTDTAVAYALYLHGCTLFNAGDYQESLRVFEILNAQKVVREEEMAGEARFMIPIVQVALNRWDDAARSFPKGWRAVYASDESQVEFRHSHIVFFKAYAKLLRHQGDTAGASEYENKAAWIQNHLEGARTIPTQPVPGINTFESEQTAGLLHVPPKPELLVDRTVYYPDDREQ